MKKLFYILLFVFNAGFVFSQENLVPDFPDYTYCELLGTQKFLSTKVNVSIDYGQSKSFFEDTRIRDEESGKVKNFNSMVDALNYMGEKGWEFVQAYIVTIAEQNVYHWLLKRKLTDEERKSYIPMIKRDFNK